MSMERPPIGALGRALLLLSSGLGIVLALQLVLSSSSDDLGGKGTGESQLEASESTPRADNREPWRRLRPGSSGGVTKQIEPVKVKDITLTALSLAAPSAPALAPMEATDSENHTWQTDAAPSRIKVAFKQAPRSRRARKRSTEPRWVLPQTFVEVVEGRRFTVEARASSLDIQGMPISISPQWIPTDPGMVQVSPAHGSEVKITIFRDGESSLRIVSPDVSKELPIDARYEGGKMIVRIAQEK